VSISAMKQALKFCGDIGDLDGPYPYVNETQIVSDSRKVLTALRQAIAEAEKQEPYGYFRYDIQLDAWVQNKESAQGVAFYTAPVHAIDMSQERVDETAKDRHEPYNPMERNADYERGFIDGRADQMKSSVDKAVNRMAQREWVGLDGDIPDLGLVTEEFYNGMIFAEDILREKNDV
jgi:hypothetical protein